MILHDKNQIEKFLREDAPLFIYHIGDLDDFYWNYTTWIALIEDSIKAILLLYTAVNPPVLLALSPEKNTGYLKRLLSSSMHLLPDKFYSHLTPGIEEVLLPYYNLDSHGNYRKMVLADKSKLKNYSNPKVISLNQNDIDEIQNLYKESYPDNSFDPRMLETGMYCGIREDNKLVSIAGVHVYSQEYKVAALGNITTHPDFRNKGYGKLVTANLCRSLLEKVDTIGLNVSQSNLPAIKSYEDLGFKFNAPYMEYMIEKK